VHDVDDAKGSGQAQKQRISDAIAGANKAGTAVLGVAGKGPRWTRRAVMRCCKLLVVARLDEG